MCPLAVFARYYTDMINFLHERDLERNRKHQAYTQSEVIIQDPTVRSIGLIKVVENLTLAALAADNYHNKYSTLQPG